MERRMDGNGRSKQADMEVDVVNARGGLARLSLAVGVHHHGSDAFVFEKATHLKMGSATGVSLVANVVRALEGVKPGISREFEEITMSTTVYTMIRDEDGSEMRQMIPEEYTMAGWRFCQQVLANNVHKFKVLRNHHFLYYKIVHVFFNGGKDYGTSFKAASYASFKGSFIERQESIENKWERAVCEGKGGHVAELERANVYTGQGVCAAFLSNSDEEHDKYVIFQNKSYHLPAWSVSILPDCKNVAFNTAKVLMN
ncbi:hypothetical protein SUGI_1176190 [Cryptomeria japonica]|nr:hypothetical protein SUGI_1176190 [Cryptomeria japonica]